MRRNWSRDWNHSLSCNVQQLSGGGSLPIETTARPDPRGGKMSIYEKEGGAKPCVHVHKHMYTRGVWGHAAPENFRF